MQFLSVLPRSLDSEQKPEFWPEGFSYPNYKGATYAKDDVNLAILESILSLYGYNKETHHENELAQKMKKKSCIRETLKLSTDADSSTSRVDREYPKTRLKKKKEKIIENADTQKHLEICQY